MQRMLTAAAAACCVALAPAALWAAAGEGIQLGPALLFPSLGVTETRDDNIGLNSEGREESDWVTSVAPGVRVLLPVQRYYLEAQGGLDFVFFKDHDDENSTDWTVGAAAGGDFPGGLSFKIGDTHAERHLVGTQEYGPGETAAQNRLRATAAYAVREALRIELAANRTAYTYSRSESRERVETGLQADVFWKFRPSLSALAELGYTGYAYDSNTAQDGSALQGALGLSWDITQKSSGHAKAGFQAKRYDEERPALGTENAEYYTLSVGLAHFFTRRTRAELELTHGSQESDFPANPYYLRTALGVGLSQRFTPKLYGRAGLRLAQDDYPNATTYVNPYDPRGVPGSGERSDKDLSWNLAAGFDVTRWLAAELGYSHEQRDSNFNTFDFDANRFSLSVKAAF